MSYLQISTYELLICMTFAIHRDGALLSARSKMTKTVERLNSVGKVLRVFIATRLKKAHKAAIKKPHNPHTGQERKQLFDVSLRFSYERNHVPIPENVCIVDSSYVLAWIGGMYISSHSTSEHHSWAFGFSTSSRWLPTSFRKENPWPVELFISSRPITRCFLYIPLVSHWKRGNQRWIWAQEKRKLIIQLLLLLQQPAVQESWAVMPSVVWTARVVRRPVWAYRLPTMHAGST